ncbi:helix-turn-helix domain-containing protein [Chryseobacterium herbae]|uniref:Helix-turn-helix domain-containing protein n=1 Tax=Chryseobacterium herbae TaxID=2976476 RepID=A0ABT2IYM2_9FLAO|nr:helix-turn-helix domain-containing protein [Chryseobacterium sp. pc1-10]MCT2563897.1 helix-turn-helix domain-containing protein [Chryseobacterium sp. pc1-10]
MDLKNLNIGSMIKDRVAENDIEMKRICKFLNTSENEVLNMYQSSSVDTELLLRWAKLLEYDFFRLYSQHLILYSPQSSMDYVQKKKLPASLPAFRKSLYNKEIIEFILDKIRKGEMTKSKVITEYKIPKSTLYKWLHKYNLIEK